MASVHHLIVEGYKIPFTIRKQFGLNEKDLIKRQLAAVTIQKWWRGYADRKAIKQKHDAATIIQRWFRGWQVRYHLPDVYRRFLEERAWQCYNDMATRIQAWWRGLLQRMSGEGDIKEQLKQRAALQDISDDMADKFKMAFDRNKKKKFGDMLTQEEIDELEAEAKKQVLYYLYKLHHLLRTYHIEGIYSCHGKTSLSYIERLMKSLKFKDYMKELRKVYYNTQAIPKPTPEIFLKNKRLAKMDELYRARNLDDEPKMDTPRIPGVVHPKPFNLNTNLKSCKPPKFERSIMNDLPYGRKRDLISRSFDKRKNVSETDFNLMVYQNYTPKEDLPPYHIDFWDEAKCPIHNCSNIFH